MNIFWQEVKMQRKSAITWTFSLCLIVTLFMLMYPAFSKEAEQILKLLEGYPDAVLKALSVDESFFSILGFYAYIFGYITLAGSIQGMNIGLSLLSKEVREKTVEFLLTKPVSRLKVVVSKVAAALFVLLFTNVLFILVTFLVVNGLNETYPAQTLLLITLYLFFSQFFFLGLGLLISVVVPKIKAILGVSLGVVLAFFSIRAIGLVGEDELLGYFTPFHYFDATFVRLHGHYDVPVFILGLTLSCLFFIVGAWLYHKKDIHSV